MKRRCFNPRCTSYRRYGGRGITVCDEWKNSYASFKEWAVSHGYANDLQIDRINNDGNYEPTNCRWVTSHENNYNKSTNISIAYRGKNLLTCQVAKETGLSERLIHQRLERGWDVERMYTTPINVKDKRIEYNGVSYTVNDFAAKFGFRPQTVRDRLRHGWNAEKMATVPVKTRPRFEYNGNEYSLEEFAEKLGMNKNVIELRYNRGWSTDRIINTPLTKTKLLSYNGQDCSVADLAKKFKVSLKFIYSRIHKGYRDEDIIKDLEMKGE